MTIPDKRFSTSICGTGTMRGLDGPNAQISRRQEECETIIKKVIMIMLFKSKNQDLNHDNDLELELV